MKEQSAKEEIAVKLQEDYCSSCAVCSALCPYGALTKDEDTGKTLLDIAKCQVCGMCHSTCPSKAIDIVYWDMASLTRYLEQARQKQKTDTLAIMCKGSAPDFTMLEVEFGISTYIPLTVPCVGRIPAEVFLKAVLMGIKEIYVLACDEDYCRFQRGSAVTGRKITALNSLLEGLGFGENIITLKQNSLKVKVDKDLCISCGNCVFYCPYDAAKLESPGGAVFDLTLCHGCGLCVAMCPAFALDLENWERDRISGLITKLAKEMKPPRILIFRCQWAVFTANDGKPAPNVRYIDLPCASRVDTSHILEAFQRGIDGVLIAACSEEDCKQEKGSGKAQVSVEKLRTKLGQIGLGERLHFCSVAPRYPEGFSQELEQFVQKIETVNLKEDK